MRISKRPPTTPGEILREEFLLPLGVTQKKLADHIGVDLKVVNRIINGKSAVTPIVALKLASTFRTTPDFWLNAQSAVDLYRASLELKTPPRALVKSRSA